MSSPHIARLARHVFAILAAGGTASCGGGGDGTTDPQGKVARVEVTAPSTAMEVGQTMQATARYFDATSSQITGRTVSWSTSSSAVATISTTGLITAAGVGSVTITATVDGVQGNLALTVSPVPVFFIAITPANPSVRQGESITLTATPQNAIGLPITGRTVTWSSANMALATITQAGVVTGVSPGSVYIRATVDSRVDSVSLRVRSLVTPSITGTSSATLVPGATGTLTGVNFGATIADNEVLVSGAPAVITSASSTSVSFVVPAKAALPCRATGPASVALVANGDTALATMPLRVASERTLAVGESLLLTADADLVCNEFAGVGPAKYLVTAFNYATHAGVRTSFRLVGSGATTVASAVSAEPARLVTPRAVLPDDEQTRHLRVHGAFMQGERQLARRLGSPRLRDRKRAGGPVALAVAPPAVGDQLTYRMRRTLSSSSLYDEVTFRVVYSGTRMVILEDNASPRAGQMDAEYVKLGDEFDQVMFDQLLAFGNPLVVDSALDNNGRMLAFFSPRVNNYQLNGQTNQILGFVTLCDFFPRSPITLPDGTVIQACPSSNEGEAFYALVPDESAGWSISLWRRLMRGTLIHEAKHIASYAWRYYYDARQLEEIWLEEATAQQASELWARSIYSRGWKQDLGWADGPNCDYAPAGGGCPDPAEGILHHFGFLYDHYASLESKSILDDPFGPLDAVIYGSSWSFIRYVTDAYSQSEQALLSALIQVQDDRGVANVVSKTGRPFSELLGMFSLASAADNYPGATITDPKLKLASWNSRDLFQNMSANITDGTSPLFPLAWPLRMRQVSFGDFNSAQSLVNQLRGGGFAAWEIAGTQSGPQALAIRSPEGGPAPALIGMTILRIQ
ncbi:MAG TPA: Ig-like domain-containing protein [Gemmatimonadaceae bacterium]